jgi:hypothetical protein
MDNLATKSTSNKSVRIIACKIIGSNGQIRDLKDPVVFSNIQIYESLYSPVVSGTIQLQEGVNLQVILNAHGNEYLYISFSRPGEENVSYQRTFRIYSCTTKKPLGDSQIQTYILHFCSEEMIFSNQQTISRTFKGVSNAEHVRNILTQTLKTNQARVRKIEKTIGSDVHVLTKYKPFEAIEYFASQSYSENGTPFVFFENRDGYNFISLETLFKQDPIDPALTYKTVKFIDTPTESVGKNSNIIKTFEFTRGYDTLYGTKEGVYANKLYTLDLIRQRYTSVEYSIVSVKNKNSLVAGYFPINDAKNRDSNALYEEYNAAPNYWLTDFGQNTTEYLAAVNTRRNTKRHKDPYRINNSNVEEALVPRKMQLEFLENTKLYCIIPGNPNYSVGFTVKIDIPAFVPIDERDSDYSGEYLITHLHHSITPEDIETALTLCRNSINAKMDRAQNENPNYKIARAF